MMEPRCLNEEDLIDLHYGEREATPEEVAHLGSCETCRLARSKLASDLKKLSDPIPAGGGRGVAEALKILGILQGQGSVAGTLVKPATPPVQGSDILTVEEVAAFLRVSSEQVLELLGDLPHIRIGGAIRIRRRSLDAFLERKERESVSGRRGEDQLLLRRDLI